MQEELIKMLEKVTEHIVICNNYDQRFSSTSYGANILKEAKALVEKAKNNAREPAVPRGFATLNEWFLSLPDQRQAQLRDDKWMLACAAFEAGQALAPAVPQGEPVLVQHRKPIVGKDGETIGYTSWIDGSGLDWWPHRSLYAAPSQEPVTLTDEQSEEIESLRTQVGILKAAVESRGKTIEQMKAAAAVPQGWKLVPIEMTDEMRDAGNEFICNRWLLKSAYAAMLAATPAAPSQPVTLTGTDLLDALRDNSWKVEPFDMPTGQGDADIGWRVVEYYMDKPTERTVAEVYKDDPAAAIIAALREKEGK